MAARGMGEWGVKYLMGTVSPGGGEKILEIDGGDGCNLSILNTAELYTYTWLIG